MTSRIAPLARLLLRAHRLSQTGQVENSRAVYSRLAESVRVQAGSEHPQQRALADELLQTAANAPLASLARLAARLLDVCAQDIVPSDAAKADKPQSALRLSRCLCLLGLAGFCIGAALWLWQDSTPRKRDRTQVALTALRGFLTDAKQIQYRPLLQVTGNSCTECPCKNRGPLWELPSGDACPSNWRKALHRAYVAAKGQEPVGPHGEDLLPSDWKRDAWGAPYLLNENEGEGTPDTCVSDILRSAGPDGIPDTRDDIVVKLPTVTCNKRKP